MAEGIVTRFDAEIGYGFARLENGSEIFIHRIEIATPGVTSLEVGDQVTLDVYRNGSGAAATNIYLHQPP